MKNLVYLSLYSHCALVLATPTAYKCLGMHISGVILAEIVKSNTLGVATLGESIVFFSDVLAEVQIPRQSLPISITSIYNSVF